MSVTSPTIGEITILESGDALSEPLRERLSRHQFERRYRAMPQLKKAELIEGVVYVASPLRYNQHGKPHSKIIAWLQVYAAATVGVEGAAGRRHAAGVGGVAGGHGG